MSVGKATLARDLSALADADVRLLGPSDVRVREPGRVPHRALPDALDLPLGLEHPVDPEAVIEMQLNRADVSGRRSTWGMSGHLEGPITQPHVKAAPGRRDRSITIGGLTSLPR